MKIVYCILGTFSPGGMDRVLADKVRWLVRHMHWEIVVVTTDQKGRAPYYRFPENVRHVDLDINYMDDNDKGILRKIIGYLYKRARHRKALASLLEIERPDVTVSLFPSESSFIPALKDGSRKVLELHFNKSFRLQYARQGLLGMIDRLRTWQDECLVRRFDRFVVLTEEDKKNWGNVPGIEVIPNYISWSGPYSSVTAHRVIAVGRLDYQKGFDRLIEAWNIVMAFGRYNDWRLEIFGRGEWHDKLQGMIDTYGLSTSVSLNDPVQDIMSEYLKSSILVMSSNYEGFGMVLVEAMSCGVPAVAFDCPCGPGEIIHDGVDGLIVRNGDISGLASAMMRLMDDVELRKRMSTEARKAADTYSEASVMQRWVTLFDGLMHDRTEKSS